MLSSFTNFERYPNIGYSPLSKDGGDGKSHLGVSPHTCIQYPHCAAPKPFAARLLDFIPWG